MAPPDHEPDLTFYPAFCFKASPTHFTWVKLAAVDVHRLRKRREFEGQDIYFYHNHPIRFVSVVGLITARTEVPRRTVLTVDDSSGETVDVVVLKKPAQSQSPGPATVPQQQQQQQQPIQPARPDKNQWETHQAHQTTTTKSDLDVTPLVPGTLLKVKGTLSSFRGATQIQLERYFLVRDTNTEMRFVDERVRFLVEVLSVPWGLTEEEVEGLRGEREREEIRADEGRRRAERKRRRMVEREERDRRRIERGWEREERVRLKEVQVCRAEGVRLMRDLGRERN